MTAADRVRLHAVLKARRGVPSFSSARAIPGLSQDPAGRHRARGPDPCGGPPSGAVRPASATHRRRPTSTSAGLRWRRRCAIL